MHDSSLTAVAMSGGVDSSVAAALLGRAGRPLVGFSMQLVDRLAGSEERYGQCCSPDDFRDARSVADRLGFPHYVLDMEEEFRRDVLDPFFDDYASARTPSPCVRCNTFLKFGAPSAAPARCDPRRDGSLRDPRARPPSGRTPPRRRDRDKGPVVLRPVGGAARERSSRSAAYQRGAGMAGRWGS
jgi:tRNA-specific 2-thiouridylase